MTDNNKAGTPGCFSKDIKLSFQFSAIKSRLFGAHPLPIRAG